VRPAGTPLPARRHLPRAPLQHEGGSLRAAARGDQRPGSEGPLMHRAKHRAAGRPSVDVLATTLVERFADSTGPRLGSTGSAGGVATLARPVEDDAAHFASTMPPTGPLPVVADPFAGGPGPVYDRARPSVRPGSSPLFGAARHAARGGRGADAAPTGPQPVRPHLVGSAVTATVLGAAATVTAVMTPPVAVETTGSLAPVQNAVPAPAPVAAPALTVPAPAPAVAPEQPAMQVAELVGGVTAEMQKLTPAVEAHYTTVANSTALSPAAVRQAAVTKALSKLGTPYRYGASGPTAFDCSGLVKWSFANAGRALPRTSRAMAGVGTPVSRANLQPGDLVFFYKPISHVGIYIGNGKIVHASRTGQPVKVSDMARMKFNTARRI
jgi:cell wall-associated NlpC family hydrolase